MILKMPTRDAIVLTRETLLVLLIIVTTGCIILPIPTPEHGEGLREVEVNQLLQLGKTTRADVLLRLGEPAKRLEEDRFFVYGWRRIHVHWVMLIMGGGGADAPQSHPHYLTLEFTSEGQLKRFKYFSWWWTPEESEYFNQILPEWMAH